MDFTSRLQSFLQRASASRTYPRLRASVLDHFGEVVPSDAWAIYLLDGQLQARDVAARFIPDAFIHSYEDVGRAIDPVMNAVIERHGPVHNLQVCTARSWYHEPLYRQVPSRFGVEHILTAPLVGDGKIIGTLNCGRFRGRAPFGVEEVAALTALASHASVLLARLPHAQTVLDRQRTAEVEFQLTPREAEIARLVAAGLNNLEIARCLFISRDTVKAVLKRMFQKVGVSARAELVSVLTSEGPL